MYSNIRDLIKIIENNQDILQEVLTDIESFPTYKHELWLTQDCLKNIDIEMPYLSNTNVDSISVFLPLNLPLYSITIFCIVPSLMSTALYFRPPKLLEETYIKIYEILKLSKLFKQIHISRFSRNDFIDNNASISDVIIFTGKYENAIEVRKKCPSALFIHNGATVNPVLVHENADIELAVKKTVEARIFNSGQDCAGPDAILVPESISSIFLERLEQEVKKIKVGEYKNKGVSVGRLVSPGSLQIALNEIEKERDNIKLGGIVDEQRQLIYPTIISTKLSEKKNYKEFFSPIFFVSTYSSKEELNSYFSNPLYKDYAMYASVFGNTKDEVKIPNSVILKNKILKDVEKGNYAYGGFGYKANFIGFKDMMVARPILISKEVYEWSKHKSLQNH